MAHQNDLRDKVADLAGKSFTPMHVRNNSLIFTVCAVQIPKDQPAGTTPYSSKIIQRPRNKRATF